MSDGQDMIKLHITFHGEDRPAAGESCWAERLTPTTAKVCNIPFMHDEFGLHDIVEFRDEDGWHEFKKVLERKTKTVPFEYEASDDKESLQLRWAALHQYFEKEKKVELSGMMAGLAMLAVPLNMSDKKINALLKGAPFCCTACVD